jgi:hypothetical protein
MQWYSEIEKFTSNSNLLSVHVYHGSQKISADKLAEYDIVLTTYQTLENDYRKESNKAKVKCGYCKKMFLPGKLNFHLKYICGPDAVRTQKQRLRVTKDKSATEKAKATMGIGGSSSAIPTQSNILREILKESGLVDNPDQVDSLSHYDLLKLYDSLKTGKGIEEEKSLPEEGSEKVDEKILIVDESKLKSIPVSDLKEELRQHQIDGWSRMKKVDILKLIIEKKLPISKSLLGAQSRQSVAPRRKKPPQPIESASESDSSSSSSDSESSSSDSSSDDDSPVINKGRRQQSTKGKTEVARPTGRRSAAVKAISTFKEVVEDMSSEDEKSRQRHPVSISPCLGYATR